MAQFHTTERLGFVQRLTREGFLVCEGVPVSRTGTLLYAPGELPIPPGPDGLVRVHRSEDEVFAPNAIASFEGKSVVDMHPGVDVTPTNWRLHAVGHMQNVRRGVGDQAENVVADLVIKDAAAIKAVRGGKRQVSLGYDADYEVISPGFANQRNILGNHVALVPQGRCGPTCSIGDSAMSLATIRDRLRAAWASDSEKDFGEALAEVPDAAAAAGAAVVHIHTGDRQQEGSASGSEANKEPTMDKEFMKTTADALGVIADNVKGLGEKFGTLETRVAALVTKDEEREAAAKAAAEKATADAAAEAERVRKAKQDEEKAKAAAKTGDSAAFATLFQDAVARAEMLIPGTAVPTFDAAAAPDATEKNLCDFKRRVLSAATMVPGKARDHVAKVSPTNADFGAMTCDMISSVFQAASEMAKVANNAGTGFPSTPAHGGTTNRPPTPAEMNARNRAFFKREQV